MQLEKSLKEIFGFDKFLGLQKEVIEALLNGNSALAIFPTGSGKSLCFQFPALFFDGLTVVVSPLIALMKDQVESLQAKNINVGRWDSTLNFNEVADLQKSVKSGEMKILYLSPEKLASPNCLMFLKNLKISLLVIDEAHCVSEWGHNFRPDYMKLAKLTKEINAEKILGLTATATKKVISDISKTFAIADENCFIGDFLRSELKINLVACDDSEKKNLLLQALKNRSPGATLVYVTLQKTAESIAAFLVNNGFDAEPYHAGMDLERRNNCQNRFMQSSSMIVVATIAFGMGVDKANIRYVYHYNLPKSIESYLQEIGRGGRDGKETICEVFGAQEDVTVLQNFVYGDTPSPEQILTLCQFIFEKNKEFSVSLYDLSNQFDIRPLVLSTFFTYLEMHGILEFCGVWAKENKLEFIQSEANILNQFNADRQDFLQRIFQSGKRGPKYLTLNIEEVAVKINDDLMRINTALNYLVQKNLIRLSLAGVQANYRFLEHNFDVKKVSNFLINRFIDREVSEIARIDLMVNLLVEKSCKNGFILNYLGFAPLERKCDCCDYCLEIERNYNWRKVLMVLGKKEELLVIEVADNLKRIFEGNSRLLTKYLCGITSPLISKTKNIDGVKITSLNWFGIFAKVPFEQVLFSVENVMKRNIKKII